MNFLLRFAWPVAFIVAALLAPSLAVAITLVLTAVIFKWLIVLRNRKLGRLGQELADLFKNGDQPVSNALERSLGRTHKQLLFLSVLGELLVLLAVVTNSLDVTVARNYALLVLLAAAPFGLEVTLALLLRLPQKSASETVRTAVGYAAEDAHALLAVVGLSFAGTLIFDIPPAFSVMQLLLVSCLARPLLSGKALQALPHKVDQRYRVLFASITVYGSFVFFFIRHYLEPRHADSINTVTWQATTLALAVFVACQAALLVFNPKAPKIIVYRGAALLVVLLLASYVPLTHSYLMSAGLAAADWVWIIIAALFYTALCLLQRQSAQHSRKSVLALHRKS